jgi:hypothetical protein
MGNLALLSTLPPRMITDLAATCPASTMLNDATGASQLDAWEASDGGCPAFPVEPCLGSVSTSPLTALREASLQCLEGTLNYPLVNNPSWQEFDEKCATFDMVSGTSFAVDIAEPRNALSNAAYDRLTCREESAGLHTSASLLGFGSFAFHAKGYDEEAGLNTLTRKFDSVGMKCLTLSLFHSILVKTGSSTTISLGGEAFDLAAIKEEHCDTKLPAAWTQCEGEAEIRQAYANADDAIPAYDAMIGMMLTAATQHCYGPTSSSLLNQLIDATPLGGGGTADIASFRFTSPRALTLSDYTDAEHGFCRNINWFITNFICGANVQGQLVPTGQEDHAKWHLRSAEAVKHGAIAIESL